MCRILCISFVFGLPLTPYFKFQFYSQKNLIGPQMLPKKLSHALLMVPSAKLRLEDIYHILVLYWPNTANFISKIRKSNKTPNAIKLAFALLVFWVIYLLSLSFWKFEFYENSEIEFNVIWEPKFSFLKFLLYTDTIFEVLSV